MEGARAGAAGAVGQAGQLVTAVGLVAGHIGGPERPLLMPLDGSRTRRETPPRLGRGVARGRVAVGAKSAGTGRKSPVPVPAVGRHVAPEAVAVGRASRVAARMPAGPPPRRPEPKR